MSLFRVVPGPPAARCPRTAATPRCDPRGRTFAVCLPQRGAGIYIVCTAARQFKRSCADDVDNAGPLGVFPGRWGSPSPTRPGPPQSRNALALAGVIQEEKQQGERERERERRRITTWRPTYTPRLREMRDGADDGGVAGRRTARVSPIRRAGTPGKPQISNELFPPDSAKTAVLGCGGGAGQRGSQTEQRHGVRARRRRQQRHYRQRAVVRLAGQPARRRGTKSRLGHEVGATPGPREGGFAPVIYEAVGSTIEASRPRRQRRN